MATPIMNAKELNAIAAKLSAQITNLRRASADVVPPGWFTTREMSKVLNCNASTLTEHLRVVPHDQARYRVYTGKKIQAVLHYRLK